MAAVRGAIVLAWFATWGASLVAADPEPTDDRTFRPTVLVRKGFAQGSGTIIASTASETLVLTAAHVVEGPGRLAIELHRYNFGLERERTRGDWPYAVAAVVVATDVAADLAVIRVQGIRTLPYVARLAPETSPTSRGTLVTSVGIDSGTRLSSWTTRILATERFEIEGNGADRLFLVTARPPNHGRSGGGLFFEDGTLTGVCIGRAEMFKGKRSGIFASGESIRRLLRNLPRESKRPT